MSLDPVVTAAVPVDELRRLAEGALERWRSAERELGDLRAAAMAAAEDRHRVLTRLINETDPVERVAMRDRLTRRDEAVAVAVQALDAAITGGAA